MAKLLALWDQAKPYLGVMYLQFGLAGMAIIAKYALNKGLNHYSFVVYRHAIATTVIGPFALVIERNVRPKMTIPIFVKILLLAFLEPVMDQNLYYVGMKYTSATFASALTNILPALTFVMAWILRFEKVNIKSFHSQGKIAGTIVTVGGAMLMTLVSGPLIQTPWKHSTPVRNRHVAAAVGVADDPIKGALMISASCTCWASFVILQAITLKTYPAELSLTALMCSVGSVQGLVVALLIERGNISIWRLHLDCKLFACVYSGIVCSGIGYYVQAAVLKSRGPVFVTSFSPLAMVIVAVMGSFVLSETMCLGRIIGAAVIVIGLYLVRWGKSRDDKHTPMLASELNILPVESSISSSTAVEETQKDSSVIISDVMYKLEKPTNNESV